MDEQQHDNIERLLLVAIGAALGFAVFVSFYPNGFYMSSTTPDTSQNILLREIHNAEILLGRPLFPVTMVVGDASMSDAGQYSADTIVLNPTYIDNDGVIRHELCHHIIAHSCGTLALGKAYEESLCELYGVQDGNFTACASASDYCQLRTSDLDGLFTCVVDNCNAQYCFDLYAK